MNYRKDPDAPLMARLIELEEQVRELEEQVMEAEALYNRTYKQLTKAERAQRKAEKKVADCTCGK